MSVVMRDEISIEYMGNSYSSIYEVTDKGIVRVSHPEMGSKKSRLEHLSPEETALILLTELVADFLER